MASQPRSGPRIARVIGAVNIGSFRVSAMIAGPVTIMPGFSPSRS